MNRFLDGLAIVILLFAAFFGGALVGTMAVFVMGKTILVVMLSVIAIVRTFFWALNRCFP